MIALPPGAKSFQALGPSCLYFEKTSARFGWSVWSLPTALSAQLCSAEDPEKEWRVCEGSRCFYNQSWARVLALKSFPSLPRVHPATAMTAAPSPIRSALVPSVCWSDPACPCSLDGTEQPAHSAAGLCVPTLLSALCPQQSTSWLDKVKYLDHCHQLVSAKLGAELTRSQSPRRWLLCLCFPVCESQNASSQVQW